MVHAPLINDIDSFHIIKSIYFAINNIFCLFGENIVLNLIKIHYLIIMLEEGGESSEPKDEVDQTGFIAVNKRAKRSANKTYVPLEGGSFVNIVNKDCFLDLHTFSLFHPLVKGKTQISTKRTTTAFYCSINGCPFDIRCVTFSGGESGYFEGLEGIGLVHNHVGGTVRSQGLTIAQKAYFFDNHLLKTDQEFYAHFCLQYASNPIDFPRTSKKSISNYRASRKDLLTPAPIKSKD